MKDIRIKISKEFPHLWVGIEASLDDMEDMQRSLRRLEDEAQEYHKSRYPHLYPNGKEPAFGGFSLNLNDYIVDQKVIDRGAERLLALIGDCETIEQLAAYKEKCNSSELLSAYMRKLKQLTDKLIKK